MTPAMAQVQELLMRRKNKTQLFKGTERKPINK